MDRSFKFFAFCATLFAFIAGSVLGADKDDVNQLVSASSNRLQSYGEELKNHIVEVAVASTK